MSLGAAVLLAAALSRAEIIERFKAPPLIKVSGLVQVVANCPTDMREEFHAPVSHFAADLCKKLYASRREQPRSFPDPGIIVVLGDLTNRDERVIVRSGKREDGSRFTRILLPAPGSSDLARLQLEIVRAFVFAVDGETLSDEQAMAKLRDSDPKLRVAHAYEQIERWLQGESVEGDDEEMLRLCRSVLEPGVARREDILRFYSRLYLYPESPDRPFCGRYRYCSFEEAIRLSKEDVRLRLFAYMKAPEVVLFGGGRGPTMSEAANKYSELLLEIARGKKSEEELLQLFAAAEAQLKLAYEEARLREEGKLE